MRPSVYSKVDAAERVAVVTTQFVHPVDAVWALFADPGKLARWWGPPGMPMEIHHHDLRPGGRVELTVSTPDGDVRARWTVHDVAPPHDLTFTFASDGLDPAEVSVRIDPAGTFTTMEITIRFSSDDTMRHALDIGFVAGVARSCATAHEVVSDP